MRTFRTLILGLVLSMVFFIPTRMYAASCALTPPVVIPPATDPSCPATLQPCLVNGVLQCISERDLCILEPIPGSGVDGSCIPASETAGLGAFIRYVNGGLWDWAFAIGIALAVLNGTIGGLQIVLSNGDSGKIEAGKTRFIWSAVGLVLLLLSGVILQFLNPRGFINL